MVRREVRISKQIVRIIRSVFFCFYGKPGLLFHENTHMWGSKLKLLELFLQISDAYELLFVIHFWRRQQVKQIIQPYVGELVRLVNEMSPYLLLGFLFAGILRVVFLKGIISRYMGKRNFRSVLNASLLGVPMPLCSCGVLPTGIGFYKNGASRGSTISFLISTPQTGVDSILATYSLLGLPLAIIRPVVALVTGVAGGLLGNRADRREASGTSESSPEEEGYERSVREVFRYGFVELLQEITKWLVIGMLVAAFLSVLIPADFFTERISSEYLAMGMMLLASVPLYICATGSIPIAAVLLMKGLSPGAALVLLMAGPATNIATMAVIGNSMGKRSLWVYLTAIIGGAVLFGVIINEWIPREWITGAIPMQFHGDMHEHPSGWLAWLSSALLLALILNGWLQKYLTTRRVKKLDREKQERMNLSGLKFTPDIHVFRVEGMTCNHCKANVEKGLGQMEKVTEVVADPDQNRVTVQGPGLSEKQVKEIIEKLGYNFGGRL
jgi:uncharacterized membrane protein YraQ (UPF0718 family)/copper chaperone CopZ